MSSDTNEHNISTIAIVGVGLIGGSLAAALRRAGFDGKILGISSPKTLSEGRRLGLIDEGFPYDGLVDAASQADLIVLCSPISIIISHLETLGAAANKLKPGAIVTDVGSTKADVVEAGERLLPEGVHFVGGHPLAGSENRGIAAADPFLFQNAYYVLCPSPKAPESARSRLGALLDLTGARVVVLEAAAHDRVAAAISHLPQLLAVELVTYLDTLGDNTGIAKHLAAGGFRDMTRIASSPYSVWKDIFATNRHEVVEAVRAFAKALESRVEAWSDDEVSETFDRAAVTRAEIPKDTKGFLKRLWDVLVEVEDTPGMILGVVGPLTERGINVKDIEVLKVREGEGGTMRLAFATQELASEAVEVLTEANYKARLRD
ncbi:MAG: prephenate dehydrogenase [Planctomycetota bacterium]